MSLEPGKYVVAVSGGIDSMVLLHILRTLPSLELIIAHYDHGIRNDSYKDRELVQRTAKQYGLIFEYGEGRLGPKASEATAREARYAFLREIKDKYQADAILTAHHQDDAIETAILNMLRGTGRKGLSALGSQPDIIRPFLGVTKAWINEYAAEHPEIVWHDDPTNLNDQYLRNYVRLHVLKGISPKIRQQFTEHIHHAQELNVLIDARIHDDLIKHQDADGLDRRWFTLLPYDVSCEVMAMWLRANRVRDFTRQTIARLVVAAKVTMPGKSVDINAGYRLEMRQLTLQITVALS